MVEDREYHLTTTEESKGAACSSQILVTDSDTFDRAADDDIEMLG